MEFQGEHVYEPDPIEWAGKTVEEFERGFVHPLFEKLELNEGEYINVLLPFGLIARSQPSPDKANTPPRSLASLAKLVRLNQFFQVAQVVAIAPMLTPSFAEGETRRGILKKGGLSAIAAGAFLLTGRRRANAQPTCDCYYTSVCGCNQYGPSSASQCCYYRTSGGLDHCVTRYYFVSQCSTGSTDFEFCFDRCP